MVYIFGDGVSEQIQKEVFFTLPSMFFQEAGLEYILESRIVAAPIIIG